MLLVFTKLHYVNCLQWTDGDTDVYGGSKIGLHHCMEFTVCWVQFILSCHVIVEWPKWVSLPRHGQDSEKVLYVQKALSPICATAVLSLLNTRDKMRESPGSSNADEKGWCTRGKVTAYPQALNDGTGVLPQSLSTTVFSVRKTWRCDLSSIALLEKQTL